MNWIRCQQKVIIAISRECKYLTTLVSSRDWMKNFLLHYMTAVDYFCALVNN